MFRPPPLPRTLPAALRDIEHGDPRVRASAAADLGRFAEVDAGQSGGADAGQGGAGQSGAAAGRACGQERPLRLARLEAALRDASPAVRSAAALALADLAAVEALPSLLFAIEDADPHVRQMALTALGEIGDSRACERLRRALDDQRPEVRFQAVIAFARVAPDQAEEALVRAMNDPDATIRHIAIRMAEEHAEELGVAPSGATLEAMRERLLDADPRVRVAAAVALAHSSDPSARAFAAQVRNVVADVVTGRISTGEVEDEAAAIELAGELGLDTVVGALERRAFGLRRLTTETFTWQAKVALARLGHPRARREILRDLAAWSRDKRTLAVAAAGRARLQEAAPVIEAMLGEPARAEPQAVGEALAALGRLAHQRIASCGGEPS
jgi:hypothetical protein